MLDSLEEAIQLLEQFYQSGDDFDSEQVVEFITGQQIKSGSDAGVFIEARNVSSSKARVYTGEKLKTRLAAKHILTMESVRALVLSASTSETVQSSIALTNKWLESQCFSDFCAAGECSHSTIAFMRYLNSSERGKRLDNMINKLSKYRDGKGGWKGFPYFFTLLALVEFESKLADEELRYAIEFAEPRFKRSRIDEPYSSRRNEILSRIHNRFGRFLLTHV